MKKILLVDDFPVDLLLIQMAIEGHYTQHQVSLAHDGEEAYQLIQRTHFQLMFLDVSMPLFDGFELMERLHADGGTIPPTIFVSGFGAAINRARALALGADDFIHKAVDYGTFKSDLKAALDRHGFN